MAVIGTAPVIPRRLHLARPLSIAGGFAAEANIFQIELPYECWSYLKPGAAHSQDGNVAPH